jgi:hypothetical protein
LPASPTCMWGLILSCCCWELTFDCWWWMSCWFKRDAGFAKYLLLMNHYPPHRMSLLSRLHMHTEINAWNEQDSLCGWS